MWFAEIQTFIVVCECDFLQTLLDGGFTHFLHGGGCIGGDTAVDLSLIHIFAVTHDGNSPLAKNAHYVIVHGFEANYAAKQEKAVNVLALAVEILNQMCIRDRY